MPGKLPAYDVHLENIYQMNKWMVDTQLGILLVYGCVWTLHEE